MNICITGNYFLTISNQIFNLIWLINMFTLGIREMSDYSISVLLTFECICALYKNRGHPVIMRKPMKK